jgi:hypothetical protein
MPRDGQDNPHKLSAGVLYLDILVSGKDSREGLSVYFNCLKNQEFQYCNIALVLGFENTREGLDESNIKV